MYLTHLAVTNLLSSTNHLAIGVLVVGGVLLISLAGTAVGLGRRNGRVAKRARQSTFVTIVVIALLTTVVIFGSALFLNSQSYTGGRVSWQAGLEIWVCGNELDLRDANGYSTQRLGSASLYEQNDKLVHVDGVPVGPPDVTLGAFMQAIGGSFTHDTLVVPLNTDHYFANRPGQEDGDGNAAPTPEWVEPSVYADVRGGRAIKLVNGQRCGDSLAEVQTFVYQADPVAKTYRQIKLSVPTDYVMSHQPASPPGDCVIIEFGPVEPRTNKLCASYGFHDSQRCQLFGANPADRLLCDYQEVQ